MATDRNKAFLPVKENITCRDSAKAKPGISFFTPASKRPLAMKEIERIFSFSQKNQKVPKIPFPDESKKERSCYSFQLAKFLSQLIASRRRKTPVHSDEEGKEKKRVKLVGGRRRFYSLLAPWQIKRPTLVPVPEALGCQLLRQWCTGQGQTRVGTALSRC